MSRWVISYEVSNVDAYIKSKKQGLVYLPVRGWMYGDGNGWPDDDTLNVNGKYIMYQLSELILCPTISRRKTNLS